MTSRSLPFRSSLWAPPWQRASSHRSSANWALARGLGTPIARRASSTGMTRRTCIARYHGHTGRCVQARRLLPPPKATTTSRMNRVGTRTTLASVRKPTFLRGRVTVSKGGQGHGRRGSITSLRSRRAYACARSAALGAVMSPSLARMMTAAGLLSASSHCSRRPLGTLRGRWCEIARARSAQAVVLESTRDGLRSAAAVSREPRPLWRKASTHMTQAREARG